MYQVHPMYGIFPTVTTIHNSTTHVLYPATHTTMRQRHLGRLTNTQHKYIHMHFPSVLYYVSVCQCPLNMFVYVLNREWLAQSVSTE
jgi:hypothetical protein